MPPAKASSEPREAAPAAPFVGLTGGIGAGKSTALAALERCGAAVLSTDAVVHELYRSEGLVREVRARFGEVVVPAGVVDRAALAELAFGTDADRAWLEGLLWPLVAGRMATWRAQQRNREPPPRAIVAEVPLLFEAGMEGGFDATIAVIAPEHVRQERAVARGHRALQERGARQLSQEEKAARATYVVVNDGDPDALADKLSCVLDMLGR
ncbi:MAG: dephospho-CoA kinase [Solirubrobacteraceae bacterium]